MQLHQPIIQPTIVNGVLIDDYWELVASEAQRMCARIGATIELDELISIGTIGLIEAAKRFDRSRGTVFATYARYRIRGRMFDGIGAISGIPRKTWRKNCHDRRLGIPVPFICHLPFRDDRADDQPDCSNANHDNPSSPRFEATSFDQELRLLPPIEATLIRLVFFEGRSICDAARRLGISTSHSSRKTQQAIASLRKILAQQESQSTYI